MELEARRYCGNYSPTFFNPLISDENAEYYEFEISNSSGAWMSKWANYVRFSWKVVSFHDLFTNSTNPVVVLGEEFENNQNKLQSFHKFKNKMQSIIWVTYKSHFRPIFAGGKMKSFGSDAGWGCTIRVGQMLLLSALKIHFNAGQIFDIELIKIIEDNLISAPFSIHNIIQLGCQHKAPGEWFSPAEVSYSLQKLLQITPLPRFTAVVGLDSVVSPSEILSAACEVPISLAKSLCACIQSQCLCNDSLKLPWKNSVLIMIPLMCGIKKLEARYYDTLKFFLKLPYCVGIIGDKSNSALFIVGYHEDSVIVLDPHIVRKACMSLEELKTRIGEYSVKDLVTVKFKDLGGSMSVGLYMRGAAEFAEFRRRIKEAKNEVAGVISVDEVEEKEGDGEEDGEYMMV